MSSLPELLAWSYRRNGHCGWPGGWRLVLTATVLLVALSLLALIWLGYPLAIWTIARLFNKENTAHTNSRSERLSVILATRDTTETIAGRVENLLDTQFPRGSMEVIVALDSSVAPDLRAALAAAIPQVRVVSAEGQPGKAGALNAGVEAATNDLLVMCDSRQSFDPCTIPTLCAVMQDRRFGAVSGSLELDSKGTLSHVYWGLERWLRRNEARIHSSIGVTGAVYATRKSLWAPIPAGTLIDDVFVPMSLILRGHRVGFAGDARAFDPRSFDSKAEGERKERTLTGVLQLLTLLPEVKDPRKNPVWLQFMCHKILRFLTPFLLLIVLACTTVLYVHQMIGASSGVRFVGTIAPFLLLLIPAVRSVAFSTLNSLWAIQRAVLSAIRNRLAGDFDVWRQSR